MKFDHAQATKRNTYILQRIFNQRDRAHKRRFKARQEGTEGAIIKQRLKEGQMRDAAKALQSNIVNVENQAMQSSPVTEVGQQFIGHNASAPQIAVALARLVLLIQP
ncbi:MAG: hypothetical protein U0074_16005 [Kouleothrix sp.]